MDALPIELLNVVGEHVYDSTDPIQPICMELDVMYSSRLYENRPCIIVHILNKTSIFKSEQLVFKLAIQLIELNELDTHWFRISF